MITGAADQLGSGTSQVLQYAEVLLVLAGILVLAYVTLRVGLPRMLGMRTPTGGPIQVVMRYPLEPKHTLYLIKAGSQVFLIGTSESQVQFLTSISAENAEEILKQEGTTEVPRKDFRQLMNWFERKPQA
jgi:flagellar biogenesis protein FliO